MELFNLFIFLSARVTIAIKKGNSASILATHPESRGLDEIFLPVSNIALMLDGIAFPFG